MKDLKEFRARLLGDRAFYDKFKEITTVEELVEKAAAEGYGFTADEFRNDTEVTSGELSLAAGGIGNGGGYRGIVGGSIAYNGIVGSGKGNGGN